MYELGVKAVSAYIGAYPAFALSMLYDFDAVLERGKFPERIVGHACHVVDDKLFDRDNLVCERTADTRDALDGKRRFVRILSLLGRGGGNSRL